MAYTYGHSIDRPLSAVRMNYVDYPSLAEGYSVWPNAFAIVPHWNLGGSAQTGTFADGQRQYCRQVNGYERCALVDWPDGWFPYKPIRSVPEHWHGSLLQEKRDGSGLLFRRNRYYDPSSARFTQEDPIGLAGGLNVYGFAAGDPVTYGDPFGLRPCHAIRSEIRTRINALAKDVRRYMEAHEGGEADQQHLRNIRGDQGALRRVREEYDNEGCNDDDDDDHRNFNGRLRSAEHFLTVRLPDPQLALNPRRHPPGTTLPSAQTTAAVVAGAGGAYLVYRGLRMVPSFLPPLWWTIPANAAVP